MNRSATGKNLGAVLDETVNQMESDVRVLKNRRVTLTDNVKELAAQRDKLSEEIASLETDHIKAVRECKEEIDSMMESAKEKLNNANSKDAEASGKLSELNENIRDSEKLIKTNEGAKKTLEIQSEDVKNRSEKLNGLIDIIEKTMKEL